MSLMNNKKILEEITTNLRNVVSNMYSLSQDSEEKNFLFWHLKTVEGWLGDIQNSHSNTEFKPILEDVADKYVHKYLCNVTPLDLNKERLELLNRLILNLEKNILI